MINIRSYLNDLEIIYSAQAHVKLGDILKLDFQPMKMEIRFSQDSKAEKDKIDWNVDGDTMKINLINFENMLGSGILDPWKVGSFNGKELFITFYSTSVEDSGGTYFILNYIFYSGKEVNNG